MFSRLQAWITARSVPPDHCQRIVILATLATLQAAGDWLSELRAQFGPLLLGATDSLHDDAAAAASASPETPALAMAPALATTRLGRLRPRAVLVVGAADALGPALGSVSAPVLWVNAEGPAPEGAGFAAIFSARDADGHAAARRIGDPVAGPVALPEPPAEDDFCLRFREYHERGYPILLAPGTGPGEEAFAFAVLFEVLRKTTALLILAPSDPARHEPVYRDAIKYNLPIVRHNRFMTSYVPVRNRVYYIEDPDTLRAACRCAAITLPGGTLADSATPPDLGLPLACGSTVVCGPASDVSLAPTPATRLRRAAEGSGLVARADTPEAAAGLILAQLDEGIDAGAHQARAREWVGHQLQAREKVAASLESLLET
ncbi:MAG: hypothetical protein ACQETK_09100 [Pseudomonadota bacterium]